MAGPFGWSFWFHEDDGPEPETYPCFPSALCEVVGADAGLSTEFGRSAWLWRTLAPPDEPLPVAVFGGVNSESIGEAGTQAPWMDAATYSLTVYASSPAVARRLCRRVVALAESLADAGTMISGEGQVMSLRRSDAGHDDRDPDPGPDGGDVWSHRIEIRVFVDSLTF